MDLYYSSTSPYARKARVVVREKGMPGWVSEIEVKPFEDPAELLAVTPVAKVPTLVDGARTLEDSQVICAYLDSLCRPSLEPTGSLAWDDRSRGAVGDAISDAAVSMRLEALRPAGERSPGFVDRQQQRIERIVSVLKPGQHTPTLGDIAVVCALSYLDLRHPNLDWRSRNPRLAEWHAVVEQRTAFREVAFHSA